MVVVACIDAGLRVINLSLTLARPSPKDDPTFEEALNQAVRRNVSPHGRLTVHLIHEGLLVS